MVGRRVAGVAVAAWVLAWCTASPADDWPHWGGTDGRNMVWSGHASLPSTFESGWRRDIDMTTAKNVKWLARLGSQTYGNPTVSSGRVFVGTNNEVPRNPALKGDRGVLMCFDETTGKFLWQLVVSKLRTIGNFNGDSGPYGICSSPTVDGDRVYLVTNQCEVLSLTTAGLGAGNVGPFKDEAEYVSLLVRTKPGKGPKPWWPEKPGPPPTLGPVDADIVWRYDMIAELDVWPQDASNCSILVIGDLLYVCTSNGVDSHHHDIPSPQAPSLIVLDRNTGKLVATDDANVGPRIFHGQWSNPSTGMVKGKPLVFWGGGDGFCYAFDAAAAPGHDGKPGTLRTVWKFDANSASRRVKDGKPLLYRDPQGPNEVIATPVFVDGRVYVATGQDPRHGKGVGTLSCIDAAAGTGDITVSGKVWQYEDMDRSFASPTVADGLVYVTDLSGTLHCLDAATGKRVWVHETGSLMFGSALVADGKVYVGNDKGVLTVLATGREKKVISEVQLPAAIRSTPIVANGVLYIACQTYLYAVQAPK